MVPTTVKVPAKKAAKSAISGGSACVKACSAKFSMSNTSKPEGRAGPSTTMHATSSSDNTLGIQEALTEFTLFPKLPLETRLQIWSYAAPEPAYIVQCDSQAPGRRFHYVRGKHPVPPVLHACRESRLEYLETDDPNDITLQRRRREHPVYKLHFQEFVTRSGRQSRSKARGKGCYMSDIDTFWGLAGYVFRTGFYSKLRGLSIAATLKHLAIVSDGYFNWWHMKTLRDIFPALKSITFLVPLKGVTFLPEVSGELNEDTFEQAKYVAAIPRAGHIRQARHNILDEITTFNNKYPNLEHLQVKWRFAGQTLDVENIVLPEAPEDPLEEIENEAVEVERSRLLQKNKAKRARKNKAKGAQS